MTESFHGRVLVVDADYDTLGTLARALRQRGHHVVLAADGRAGLQRAVEVAAQVVLVDRDLATVDIRTFLEVLRDNPRTSGAHTFVMGTGDPTRLAAIDARAEPIVKPFNAEEVAARVEDVLRLHHGGQREPELRGDIAQVALYDLLQVFAVNRRTGRLWVDGAAATGEVWVRTGRIVDASYGGVLGEKALYRILSITRGKFVFFPNLEPDRERIDAGTDLLLMEAARQADEMERLREDLPDMAALVSLAFRPEDATSVAREVVENLDEPRAIEELLDLISRPDLEVLAAVRQLMSDGVLLVFDPRGQRVRLCDEDEAIALRAAAGRLRRPGLEGPPRLAVVAASAAEMTRFGRAMSHVQEFVVAAQPPVSAGRGSLGLLGTIRLAGVDLEIFALPLEESLRPLWVPLLAPTQVMLLLTDSEDLDDNASELLRIYEIRCVPAPTGWERPAGAAEAIRLALGEVTSSTGPMRAVAR